MVNEALPVIRAKRVSRDTMAIRAIWERRENEAILE